MTYFAGVGTQEELKSTYRKLCKLYHPDKGGSTAQMQDINNEYERLMKQFISGKPDTDYGEGKWYKSREQEEEIELKIREAIEKIAHIDGINIEIIGAWVWVDGETKPHKQTLKDAGYWWMNKKEKWAFKGKPSSGRGNTTMEELREKYGSEKVYTGSRRLTA